MLTPQQFKEILAIVNQLDDERDAIDRARKKRADKKKISMAKGSHIYIEGSTPPGIPSIFFGSHTKEVSPGLL